MFFLSKIKDASILWVQLLNLPEHVRIYNIIIIYISTYIEQSFLTYFLPCSCTDLTWMKDVYSNYKCNLAILRSQICISLEINFGISILTRKIKFIMGCTASSIQVKFVEWPDQINISVNKYPNYETSSTYHIFMIGWIPLPQPSVTFCMYI